MSADRYIPDIARITCRPIGEVRQRWRAAREAGFLPSGRSVTLSPTHVARLVIALACDQALAVGPTIARMRNLPRKSADGPPGTLEAGLAAVIAAVTRFPVLGDLDISSGHIEIDAENGALTLFVHNLFGHRVSIEYAEADTVEGALRAVKIIPIETLRDLARSLLNEKTA